MPRGGARRGAGRKARDGPTEPLLREYGCDFIQGFHIARPAAAGLLGPWLRARAGLNGALSA